MLSSFFKGKYSPEGFSHSETQKNQNTPEQLLEEIKAIFKQTLLDLGYTPSENDVYTKKLLKWDSEDAEVYLHEDELGAIYEAVSPTSRVHFAELPKDYIRFTEKLKEKFELNQVFYNEQKKITTYVVKKLVHITASSHTFENY